jgi:hypothetical protein
MANTCINFIEINGDQLIIDKVVEKYKSELYDIQWNEDGCLQFSYESRWSPPVEWLKEMSIFGLGLTLECEYEEIGSDIWGKFGFRDGELIFAMELSYLEGKYNSMKWNEFIESEVISRIEDNEDVDTFLDDFPFVSDEQREELITIFNEGN